MKVIKDFKIKQKLLILALITLFTISGNISANAQAAQINPGEIIINEINWAGSSMNSSDEWIEIYNSTDREINLSSLILIGASSRDIPLMGTLQPKSFYLISRYDENSDKSILRIKPNLIPTGTTISLPNTRPFHLILKEKTTSNIIDEVNSQSDTPPAGSSETNLKSSMAKKSTELNSNDMSSWQSSNSRINLDNKVTNPSLTCGKDLSTPGAPNFLEDPNEISFEFEESCFSQGEIKEIDNSKYLNIFGPKVSFNALDLIHNFGKGLDKYSVELHTKLPLNFGNKGNVGTFTLRFGNENVLSYEEINSRYLESNVLSFRFLKPDLLDEANLNLTIHLDQQQSILLDKVVIKKVSNESTDTLVNATNLSTTNDSTLLLDEDTGKEVKFFASTPDIEQLRTILQDNFTSAIIGNEPTKEGLLKYKLKFANFKENISLISPIARLEVKNPFTGSIFSKDVRKKDILENEYQEYMLSFIPEVHGAYEIKLISYNKSDIYLESISTSLKEFTTEEALDTLDLIQEDINFEYVKERNSVIIPKSQNLASKILSLDPSAHCSKAVACESILRIRFFDKVENLGANDKLAQFFLMSIDPDGIKSREVLSLSPNQFIDDTMKEFRLQIPVGDKSMISLGLFTQNNASIEIENIKLLSLNTYQQYQKPLVVSTKNIDWNSKVQLKTGTSDLGFKGKVVDLLQSSGFLGEGKYKFSLDISKLEKYNSNEELLRISAYDETGKQLFAREISENDLSLFDVTRIEEDFEMPSTLRRIYIEIKFYGNHFGGFSDIELEKMNLEKIVTI